MLIRFDQKILEYRDVVLNFLSNLSNTLSDQITSFFNGIFDKIDTFLSDFFVKFTGFFDSIINWINTKAIEFFTSIVEPIISIFLDMVIKLFTEGILALVSLPGSVVESAVSSAFGVFKEVINTATFGGFDVAVNATVNLVNEPGNVIKAAMKGIPDLV